MIMWLAMVQGQQLRLAAPSPIVGITITPTRSLGHNRYEREWPPSERVAGSSLYWDADPEDPYSEPTPSPNDYWDEHNSFYVGPNYANSLPAPRTSLKVAIRCLCEHGTMLVKHRLALLGHCVIAPLRLTPVQL